MDEGGKSNRRDLVFDLKTTERASARRRDGACFWRGRPPAKVFSGRATAGRVKGSREKVKTQRGRGELSRWPCVSAGESSYSNYQ